MTFNSLPFILFALAFFPMWYAIRNQRLRLLWLASSSFFFYAYWDWRFLFLLLGTGFVDYRAAVWIRRYPAYRQVWLSCSMLGNLGTLAIFKYLGFFVHNANALLALGGHGPLPISPLGVALPLGISFYTFMAMSYTIDVYSGEIEPKHSPVEFFAWLSMFPHLVAGPIVRASKLLPQLDHWKNPSSKQRWEGCYLIAGGFFKKCVIADNLSVFVDAAYAAVAVHPSGLYWWAITAMFGIQIYSDFSGYSDIARGLAKLLAIEFPLNFDHPYLASSFREFWSRWHISLSTWFRDYVYIPIGGNGPTKAHAIRNMWITMVLSGFWHGAQWTFIIWGALHAFFLTVERLTRWPERLEKLGGRAGHALAVVIVFALTTVSWVFFRAGSLADALTIVGRMVDARSFVSPGLGKTAWFFVLLSAVRHLYCYTIRDRMDRWGVSPVLRPVAAAALLCLAIYLRGPGHTFIYFQF